MGSKGSPYTVVIDRTGEIVQRWGSARVSPSRLPKLLDSLLKPDDLPRPCPTRGAAGPSVSGHSTPLDPLDDFMPLRVARDFAPGEALIALSGHRSQRSC